MHEYIRARTAFFDQAVFLFEGVAVYLERDVTERVLAEFRAVTPTGGTLAISLPVHGATSPARARFQQRTAELGEAGPHGAHPRPGRRPPDGRRVERPAEVSGRQSSAGLLLARAATLPSHPERVRPAPSPPVPPPTPAGRRRGTPTLHRGGYPDGS